jgi:AP-2 complex subunit alpha
MVTGFGDADTASDENL